MAGPTKGFLYAAAGADYAVLARRSARNLRLLYPKAQIDLFTDQDLTDPVFDRIHPLKDGWFRPKMESLLRSRFDITVLLDADTIPLAGIGELFDALTHADMAASPAVSRPAKIYAEQRGIPRAFPYVNCGVMAVRRSRQSQLFIREWQEMVRANAVATDQPAFRWLLFHRRPRFQILPPEYNLMIFDKGGVPQEILGTPRILHVPSLHRADPGDPEQPFDPAVVIGAERWALVQERQKRERFGLQKYRQEPKKMTGAPLSWSIRLRFHLLALWIGGKASALRVLRRLR